MRYQLPTEIGWLTRLYPSTIINQWVPDLAANRDFTTSTWPCSAATASGVTCVTNSKMRFTCAKLVVVGLIWKNQENLDHPMIHNDSYVSIIHLRHVELPNHQWFIRNNSNDLAIQHVSIAASCHRRSWEISCLSRCDRTILIGVWSWSAMASICLRWSL